MRERVWHYETELRHVQPMVDGDYLKSLGLKPSPLFSKLLHAVRDALLDGEIHTVEEEKALIARLLAERGRDVSHDSSPQRPRRIAVVGTSGSGKTTLARRLAQRLGIPHVELDALHWEPDWTPAPRDVSRARGRGAERRRLDHRRQL